MEIQKTKDYSLFKFILSNREVDHNHIKRLAKSIQRNNLLYIRPLIVNDKMELIDGQHRLEAAKQIGAEVYFMKVPKLTKSDIAVLNSAQKNWTRSDFINFYAMEGNEDYKKLAQLIDQFYWLQVSVVVAIACGGTHDIKEGKIKIKDYKRAVTTFGQLRELEPKFPFVTKAACSVAVHHADLTPPQFKKLLMTATAKSFRECNKVDDYKRMILDHLK